MTVTSILRENGDAAALIVLLIGLVVVMSCWELRPFEWFRREWRLMWQENFGPVQHEHVVNPALGSTRADVGVAQMEAKQYALCEEMKRRGDWLLHYPPQMPPKASKVRRPT